MASLSSSFNILNDVGRHLHRHKYLFCSQRFGNRSSDKFGNIFGKRFDGAEGAASFLTCLVFKTVQSFSSAMLKPKGGCSTGY